MQHSSSEQKKSIDVTNYTYFTSLDKRNCLT